MDFKATLAFFFILLIAGGCLASSVTRSFSSSAVPVSTDLIVTLTVSITAGETFYAIDETLPAGWALQSSGTGDNTTAGHLKWVVTQGAANTSYSYTIRAPATTGIGTFSGVYQFELPGTNPAYVNITIAGPTTVTVQSGGCTSSAQCTGGQVCCSGTCRAATCTPGSTCCSASGCSLAVIGTSCTTDNFTCTTDTCNATGQCTHSLLPNTCLISLFCYAFLEVNPTNACQECISGTTWSNKLSGTSCGTTNCPTAGTCTGNTPNNYPATCNRLCNGIGTCQSCTCTLTTGTACGNTAVCSGGSCLACGTGYRNCDLDPANACEINIFTSNSNCGNCGNVCGTNYQCQSGTCVYVDPCTGINCGANASCSGGNCSCSANYGNCNGLWSDGCEANFLTSNSNCGSCGNTCQAGQQCQSGTCVTTNPCAAKADGTSCGTNKYCCAETCRDIPTGCTGCKNTSYTCSGSSLVCGNTSGGTACTSDGIVCTNDICDGSGNCTHPFMPAGTTCATQNSCSGTLLCTLMSCSATGTCNVPANCNGCSTTSCPTGASGSCQRVCIAGACLPCTPSCIETNCTDLVDNDNDGLTDGQDPNCSECFGKAAGTSCTNDGLACTTDTCDGSGTCTHILTAGNCLISGTCYASGAVNPSNQCQSCASGTSWGSIANGTACNDGNACTVNDACSGGTCSGTAKNCGANASCSSGICGCAPGFVDCDNNTSNGCEATSQAGCPCVNGTTRNCTTAESCSGTQSCSAGAWGTCVKNASTCTTGTTESCIPSFDGNSCSALTGIRTCDACGTSWGSCIAGNSAVCCPTSTRACDTPLGCTGTQSCSAAGQWGTCNVGSSVCTPLETGTCTPTVNGTECASLVGNRSCDACGTSWGSCQGPTDISCCPGQSQSCTVGDCAGTMACDSSGQLGSCTKTDPSCGSSPQGPGGPIGPGGPGGPGGAKIAVNVQGSCIGQPTTVFVLNESGNPAANANITVVMERKTVTSGKTGTEGKMTFTLEEPGEYLFYVTKTNYVANSKKLNLIECGAPTIEFEPEIETGTEQVILLKSGDGSLIQDFNVLLTYPDKTTRLLQAIQGMLVLPIDKVGKYTAILQTNGFEQTIGFEAKAPGQIVPPINPGAEPMVTAVFGAETVYAPNYLIIWILAIAVISGFIIEVTKLRPGWFRVFMAITYTTLPLVVNYYTKNVELAFAIISLQTTILTMLWFRKWKARRALESLKALETKLQPITSAIKSEAPAVSKQQPQGTEKKEAPAGQKPEGNGKQGGTGGQQPIENIENSTFPGNREF